MQPI
jgi:hypothetical protein